MSVKLRELLFKLYLPMNLDLSKIVLEDQYDFITYVTKINKDLKLNKITE